MSDDEKVLFDPQITAWETYLIGKIILLWGDVEGIIFQQLMDSLADGEDESAPMAKTILSSEFKERLDLWKRRIIDTSDASVADVLLHNHSLIAQLVEYREALVYGMFEWDLSGEVATLVSRRTIDGGFLTVSFRAGDLEYMAARLGEIVYQVRCPRGERLPLLQVEGIFTSRLPFLSGRDTLGK
jgi:hypothetical protein